MHLGTDLFTMHTEQCAVLKSPGIWCMRSGVLLRVHAIWCTQSGACDPVHATWCMRSGACDPMHCTGCCKTGMQQSTLTLYSEYGRLCWQMQQHHIRQLQAAFGCTLVKSSIWSSALLKCPAFPWCLLSCCLSKTRWHYSGLRVVC